MLQRTLHVTLFLVGLFGAAVWIRSLDSVPFASFCQTKLRSYAKQAEEFDTVFVGSSRVLRAVRPDVFDAVRAEQGVASSSCNMAFAGLQTHDVDPIIDFVLKHRSPRLKTMIVELTNWERQDRPNWMTAQVIEGHTPQTALARIETALGRDDGFMAQLRSVGWTLSHTAVNGLNIGQGTRIVEELLRPQPAVPLRHGGWLSFSAWKLPKHRYEQNAKWLASADKAAEKTQLRLKSIRSQQPRSGLRPEAIVARAQRIRAAGIEPVFIIPPGNSWFRGRSGVEDLPDDLRVIALDDPTEHPDLYVHTLWFDNEHLADDGAALFSRKLGEAVGRE